MPCFPPSSLFPPSVFIAWLLMAAASSSMQEVTFGDNKKEKREGGNRGVWRSGVNFPCFLRVNLSGREISALATDDDDDDAVGIIVLEGEGKTTAATACSNSFRSLMFLFFFPPGGNVGGLQSTLPVVARRWSLQ